MLEDINFETPGLRLARLGLSEYEKKVKIFSEMLKKERTIAEEQKSKARKLAFKLRKTKLGNEAIETVLREEFHQKDSNIKSSDKEQKSIMEFISEHSGCKMVAIKKKFPNINTRKIKFVLKAGIKNGVIKTENKTNQTTYKVVKNVQ